MDISKQLSRNIYIMFSICFGGESYIYITRCVGGDTFIGVCAFAVTGVFALMLYNVCTWFKTYAFPTLNSIIVSQRKRKGQTIVSIEEGIPAIAVDQEIENDIPKSDNTQGRYTSENRFPLITEIGENNALSNDNSSTTGSGIGEAITEIILQLHAVPTTGGGGTSNDLGWGDDDKNKNYKPRKRR